MQRHRPQVSSEELANARRLRRDMSVPEKLLWGQLRSGRLCGLKFRRQHPFGPYVLDFFCLTAKLAVELDGESHAGRAEHDERRTEYLESHGVRVLRIQNDELIRDLDNVLEGILLACGMSLDGKSLPGQPSPGSLREPPSPEGRGFFDKVAMNEAPHYLDHNATTPIDPRVADAMDRAWRDVGANPASQHAAGRKARRVLEECREGIVSLLGAKTSGMEADRLIFTSGGTEANNLALFGVATATASRATIISAIEHPSILGAADELARRGTPVIKLPVNQDGVVDIDALQSAIRNLQSAMVRLVSVMLANNETGVIQPVKELAAICQAQNIPVHTDAVQAVGKILVSFRDLGVAAMTVAPHKFHGPLGIGALIVRHDLKLQPLLIGGFQQAALRPGTECVPLAVGFFTALKLYHDEAVERQARMTALRDRLEQLLLAGAPDAVVIGANSPRLPQTTNIAFPGINRQALVMALDMAGVACSTGSACASGSSEPSPALLAMGLEKSLIEGSIRLSFGAFTTETQADEAARRILKCINHLRQHK